MTPPQPNMTVRVFSTRDALATAVADKIIDSAATCVTNQRPFVLGLASGQSPQEIYRVLHQRVRAKQLDLSRCIAFCLDEYYPISSLNPRSFAFQMAGTAIDLGIPLESFHFPDGHFSRDKVEYHCRQYEEMIRSVGGITLQIVGVGRSGHIGFNEPESSRHSRTRLVQLNDLTRLDAAATFNGLRYTPKEAFTMGIETILEAEEIALIAIGSHKAEIVHRLLNMQPSPEVPASYLQDHDHTTVYLDESAAKASPNSI
ncbi:MAG: glucosamine-6-phosphate deaminase [Deltaproteobacteria bacterium]|nr:glucosamine-6-phosphate deaminase [Deltaproteobacteria bacterium]